MTGQGSMDAHWVGFVVATVALERGKDMCTVREEK